MDNLTGTVLQAARDMAANGFVALAVDYDPDRVSRESDLVRSVAEEQLSLRLNTAVDWLARQRPLVDPQRISAIGWGGGSARVLKLGQQGEVRAGVMIEEAPCRGPQNLPAIAVARILVIFGGCAPKQGQDLTRNYEGASSTYQVRALEARVDSFPQPSNTSAGSDAAGQVWSEVYRFLEETAGDSGTIAREAPVASSSSVATIRDIMRVINSDEGVRGKLAGLLAASSSEDTHWEQARSHAAILVESCDWLLALRPSKGALAGWRGRVADFRDATQTLLLAVEKQDLPAAQQALGRLPESCAACHLDHR
jgi:dienelactone hydrolase